MHAPLALPAATGISVSLAADKTVFSRKGDSSALAPPMSAMRSDRITLAHSYQDVFHKAALRVGTEILADITTLASTWAGGDMGRNAGILAGAFIGTFLAPGIGTAAGETIGAMSGEIVGGLGGGVIGWRLAHDVIA